jgi:hypothetical protein
MPRAREYESAAARQAAYRRRNGKRNGDVTNRDGLGAFMEWLEFVRDTAGDVSRDSIKNWRGWQHSSELHCHALQDDLDRIVEMLGALLSGDSRPFQGSEFADWKQKRDARRKIN